MARPVKNYYSTVSRGKIQFHRYKKGEKPCAKNKYETSGTNKVLFFRLFSSFSSIISYCIATCILHTFVRDLPKWSKPSYFKAEALAVAQKI